MTVLPAQPAPAPPAPPRLVLADGVPTTRLYHAVLAETSVRHERMMAEARHLIDSATDRGLVLRLTGGLAVRHYAVDLAFAEREYSDIDLIGLRRQTGELDELFATAGYVENGHVLTATGGSQRQFVPAEPVKAEAEPAPPTDHIDVFLDAIKMDHQIEMRERLTINTYAITPADIFLSKLQIVRLNEKDAHDVITLCKDVYIDFEDRPGVLNLSHIAETCAQDWGLYIDVMNNIDIVLDRLSSYDLTVNAFTRVRRSLELAQHLMTEQSKSLRWRLRARIGKRVRWYSEVEEQMPGREPAGQTAVRTKEGVPGLVS